MKTALQPIEIMSIYKVNGQRVLLPKRMAQCTPDTREAILRVGQEIRERGGALLLSDLFRSYDMQLQSHLDFAKR
jgi:zinc D-Ala-D-Ala carboxypeptidase